MINVTVIKEMLTQRGYTIDEFQEHEDLITAERNLGERENDPLPLDEEHEPEKICVFKEIFEKLNIKDYISCTSRLNELDMAHGVVIYVKITPAVNKILIDANNTGDVNEKGIKCTIEVFQIHELSFNPCKHSLTPAHTRVADDEAKVLRNNFDASKFPTIKSTDPIVRFLAFKKGDIIKIVRKTGFVAYRVVR